jgi:hypothetical protein
MKVGAKCDHSKRSQEVIADANGRGIRLTMAIECTVTDPVLHVEWQPEFLSTAAQRMWARYFCSNTVHNLKF